MLGWRRKSFTPRWLPSFFLRPLYHPRLRTCPSRRNSYAMSKLSGVHPGFRANHATGIVVAGSFEATPHAAQLSKAVLFSGLKIPATARFSDVPNIEDGSVFANPWHGDRIPSYPKPTSSSTRSNSFRYPALQISGICWLQRLRAHKGSETDNARAIHRDPSDCAACASDGTEPPTVSPTKTFWHQLHRKTPGTLHCQAREIGAHRADGSSEDGARLPV
jgi:hypothetical protein